MSTPTPPTPLLLAPEEVQEITGLKRNGLQVAWLQRKGWRFELNAVGRPIVARRYAEKMLGCDGDDDKRHMPRFTALRSA